MLNNVGDRTLPFTPVLICFSFEVVSLYCMYGCNPFMWLAMKLMVFGMFVSVSLCMFAVSNTAHIQSYCNSALLWPFVIWWQMFCKAVCVKGLFLNPC